MAYFECVIGGGGTSLTIQITTSSTALYGQTITISKGGSTVGTTAFDNTGSAEYTVRETGTYMVSVTMSGVTFSDTVEVTDTFDATIEATPDGSTVTPVNDIQIWLHCGNVWNKNYTTLSEVLADTTTLLALINSNNAVDYMVRSHAWCNDVCADATAMTYIGANNYAADTLLADDNPGLVPKMTSNTEPSGYVASASSVLNSSYAEYGPFSDGAKVWYSAQSNAHHWIRIELPSAVIVKRIDFKGTLESSGLRGSIRASNNPSDESSWVNLITNIPGDGINISEAVNNNTAYKYYEFYRDSTSSSAYMSAIRFQLYAKATCWLESICNSTYFESVLNVKVPTMTSNTTPSGEASSGKANTDAYKMFDGNDTTYWTNRNASTTSTSDYVQYKFATPVCIKRIYLFGDNSSSTVPTTTTVLTVKGSNDGNFTDIGDVNFETVGSVSTDNVMEVNNDDYYLYYRLAVKTTVSNIYMYIRTLQFYGRADV